MFPINIPAFGETEYFDNQENKAEEKSDVSESTQNNEAIFNYKTVLRCGRSYEDDVRVALSTLTRQNKKRIAINTVGVSGTIKSGISKYIED
mgnify:CR=1 FL=1